MVDRHARDIAADVLRTFMQGSISNDEYERAFPKSKDDPALWAVHEQIWLSYSDLKEHTLTGKHALTDAGRAVFERCILFLQSDLEFQWPPPKIRLRYAVLRLLGFGWLLRRWEAEEMSIGDVEVWPFLKRAQYEELCRQSSGGSN
jgi:hypothetical protein